MTTNLTTLLLWIAFIIGVTLAGQNLIWHVRAMMQVAQQHQAIYLQPETHP